MRSVKNVLSLLVALLMVFSIVTGCGSGTAATPSGTNATATNNATASATDKASEQPTTQPAAGKIAVTFWTLSDRQTGVEQIVSAFNQLHDDITVTASYYDVDGIKNACKVAASSKTLPNMWFTWGGSLGGFYSDNGLTYDLTNYAKAHNWDNVFSPGAISLCTRNGQLTGYPTSYNVVGMYYRKDIFEKYNISIPTTFDDFEAVCATLKQNGITPITTAGLNGWHVMRILEQFIEHYAGADLHDKMNTFQESYDNDAVVQALTKYKEFCDKGYFPDGFLTIDPNDTNLLLFSGQAAMDIQGQWYDGNIVQNKQDMSLFGVFPFPNGGTNRMSAFAEMTQFNANDTDAELDACMQFMDYYYSDVNVQKYGEYFNLPIPKQGQPMPEGMPNVPLLYDFSNKNSTFTITDQAFPTQVADALFNVQDAIANGQTTPKDGAAQIQAAIEAYKAANK